MAAIGWACALFDVQRFALADGRRQRVRIPLRCSVHPRPSCLVACVRIAASLSPCDGLLIVEIQPQSTRESCTRTDKTTRRAGMSAPGLPLSLKLAEEQATEREIGSWTVSASGTGTARAMWSFVEHPQAPIPPEHALTIALDSPSDHQGIQADVRITADVRRQGRIAKVPLIGNTTVRLALAATL